MRVFNITKVTATNPDSKYIQVGESRIGVAEEPVTIGKRFKLTTGLWRGFSTSRVTDVEEETFTTENSVYKYTEITKENNPKLFKNIIETVTGKHETNN